MSELREAFQRQAPPEPSTHGWADGARARHRRRRTAGGVVALGVVAALAVPLGLTVLNNTGDPVVPAEPAPTYPTVTAAEICDPFVPPYETDDEAMIAIDQLPDEAARIWLCPDAPGTSNVIFPEEPLTDADAVSEAVELFNGFEEVDLASIMCTAEYTMTYTVVFEYLDGDRLPVRGELHGCRLLYTGPTDNQTVRMGGEELLSTLTRLWAEQREESPPPALEGACEQGPTLLPGDLTRVEAGYACSFSFETTGPQVEIDPELARRIAELELGAVSMQLDADMRIALVDAVGGTVGFLYDGRYLFDEKDWSRAVEVPEDLRAELDAVRDLLGS